MTPQPDSAPDEMVGATLVGDVWQIVLRRPAKRNALTLPMFSALTESLAIADAHPAVRAITLTGQGPGFCAGHDLQAFDQWPQRANDPVPQFLHALARVRKPLVVGVHGSAAGVGVTMLLHADWVIADPNTQLRLPFVDLGIAPEAASTLLLSHQVGTLRAKQLLLGGERFSGEDAERWGLVTELAPAPALQARVLERARLLGAKDADAYQRIKSWLVNPGPVHERIDEEIAAINNALERRRAQPTTTQAPT